MTCACHKLGRLYANHGKLVEAERMYQRALRGYEKAHGADNAASYIPALNTIWNLGSLLEDKVDFAKARIMYSKALVGFDEVVGPDHPNSRSLRDRLRILDERMDNKAPVEIEERAVERMATEDVLGRSILYLAIRSAPILADRDVLFVYVCLCVCPCMHDEHRRLKKMQPGIGLRKANCP
ncbi:hypothetical protein DL98DRAFT_576924 [Cadophora sp. DSE1049]|nr:hypothetical protein DL98DRAFT_576924 [Cadophora sp. DSE1049]